MALPSPPVGKVNPSAARDPSHGSGPDSSRFGRDTPRAAHPPTGTSAPWPSQGLTRKRQLWDPRLARWKQRFADSQKRRLPAATWPRLLRPQTVFWASFSSSVEGSWPR